MTQSAATATAVPVQAPTYAYVAYVPKEPREKKQCGSACCCLCCLLFLLLFFLIPRSPGVYFQQLKVEREAPGNYTEYGEFKFRNYNFYDMTWSDLKIDCFWLSDTDYSGLDCKTVYYRGDQYCQYQIGAFDRAKTFHTNSQSSSYEDIKLSKEDEDQRSATQLMAADCFSGDKQLIKTSGTVKGKSDSHDYGKIHVTSSYYELYC